MESNQLYDNQYEQLIQLYPGANLDKVVDYFVETLQWSDIELKPEQPLSIEQFHKRRHLILIADVVLPKIPRSQFMAFARDITNWLNERMEIFLASKTSTKEQKMDMLMYCMRICIEEESKYDYSNLFRFALDFKWKVLCDDGHFRSIQFELLQINAEQVQSIYDELNVRIHFFRWFRKQIDTYARQIESNTTHDVLIEWDYSSPKLAIAELIYAMERSEVIKFKDGSKKAFRHQMESLFALDSIDWATLEADIRKRKGNRSIFLQTLADAIK